MDPTRSRGDYVGRLAKAAAQGLTGTFEVRGRGGMRRLHMSRGEVVWSQTDVSGAQNAEEVADAVARPLAWEPCTVQFEELRNLSMDAMRASVGESVPVRRALWMGAERHIELNDVLSSVIDPAAGPIRPTLGLWAALTEMGLEEPYSGLANVLGPGITVDELLRRIPDRSGILMKLVWFLERAELVERPRAAKLRPKPDPRDRAARPTRPEQIRSGPVPVVASAEDGRGARVSPTEWVEDPTSSTPGRSSDVSRWGGSSSSPTTSPKPARSRRVHPGAHSSGSGLRPASNGATAGSTTPAPPTTAEVAAVIAKNVRQRTGRDYYTFLGIPSKAAPAQVELACRRLLRRWNVYGRREDLDARARKNLDELMAALQLVYRTLGNSDRKAEYDRRVDRGTPPIVGQLRAAKASRVEEAAAASRGRSGGASTGDLLEVMRAMESKSWDRALAILQTLRMNNPSDPDVLAELGWCAHNRPGAAGEGPEEYLLLATTFAPDHLKATEYLARIALENQDIESARLRLTKLRGLAPHNRWARRTLRELPPPKEP